MNVLDLTTRVLAAVVLIHPWLATGAGGQVGESDAESLKKLTYMTGWIDLGEVTADRKRWATGRDPAVPYLTGTFEIVGKKLDRRKPVFPKVGDRIRLTVRARIIILDYAEMGEEHRLEPPVLKRALRAGDETGLYLEPGAVVQVRAVIVSQPFGQIRGVFARVSPTTK